MYNNSYKIFFEDCFYFLEDGAAQQAQAQQDPQQGQQVVAPPTQDQLYQAQQQQDTMGQPVLPGQEVMSLSDIGKIYVMKKIYSRLISLDDLLADMSSPKFDPYKEKVKESIDIFHTIVANFAQFRPEIDDFITLFQELIYNCLEELDKL